MTISGVRIHKMVLPRVDPAWRTAHYSGAGVCGFILELDADGLSGIGSTAAHVSQISAEDLEAQIDGPVRRILSGADPLAGNVLRRRLRDAQVHSRAMLAADLALQDLLGKLANQPCHVLWGGAVRPELKVVRMVGIKAPPALEAAAAELHGQGYRHLKVKVGTGIADDVERIRTLRSAFGSDLWISVDGNEAYTPEEAIELSRRLEPYDVRLIEQPVAAADVDGLARVTAGSPVPIMADQCVFDVASALEVCQRRAAHVISLKLTKTGSVDVARQICVVCEAFGVGVHVGGSVALAAVDAAQAQLAAVLPAVSEECEVGEFLAVSGAPLRGFDVVDGRVRVGAAPGLGLQLAAEQAPQRPA
jgi:L-alanine-DL-glutamate epimerase-like enolase superfamily enzyme